ncbi:MAG: hypothetical protein NDI95_08800 [Acidovorax soli]|uniref:hypothetical protein n=1 Tax=Acidovorax soli TaxID=592050 RepID=UPI0026F32F64|nr:hypothetical protein [Acidovorax soli]MCM2346734.1 hypothetical protein [Acidovorax soli]
MLNWQWKETLNAEMRQNTNTAVAFKEHTLRILDTVDQAMRRVENSIRDGQTDGREMIGIANETGMVPHILTQLSFVDARGIFRSSNLDPDGSRSKNVSLMDRDHIRVHLKPESTSLRPMKNGLFISTRPWWARSRACAPSSSRARSSPRTAAPLAWLWPH